MVTGIDFTESGIELARRNHPSVRFEVHDLNDPLPETLRHAFDVVVCAEVIEHLFLPRMVFVRAKEALGEAGSLIVTTPFHGYFKRLALALGGRSDQHFDPLADYGHIKFFSKKTLAQMARQCGFEPVRLAGAGRIPPFAATMVMTATRTGD
jgi:2-polyprenyl-6-hydroxyphenyl methylase/3-demethylubiquinone-9 3-methyltransferase